MKDDIENSTMPKEEKRYSQEEIEEIKAKLKGEVLAKENEMQKKDGTETEKAGMSEIELLQTELEKAKEKCQKMEDECLISKQKEETLLLLDEAKIDREVLNLVYVPKSMDLTKANIETLKNYIEKIKKSVFQNCINIPVPLSSKNKPEYDPFIEGFDTNKL